MGEAGEITISFFILPYFLFYKMSSLVKRSFMSDTITVYKAFCKSTDGAIGRNMVMGKVYPYLYP